MSLSFKNILSQLMKNKNRGKGTLLEGFRRLTEGKDEGDDKRST